MGLKRELIDQSSRLRRHVEARKLASAEEVEAHWPVKGEKSPLREWVKCSQQLTRFVGRQEFMKEDSEFRVRERLKALRDEPEAVELLDGTRVKIHPKSYVVLQWLSHRMWRIDWLTYHIEVLRLALSNDIEMVKKIVAKPDTALEQATDELSYQTAVCVWVVTHPGPGFPFAAGLTDDQWPKLGELPEYVIGFDPFDLYAIQQAFLKVNILRIGFLPQKEGKKVNFDTFFAALARRSGQPASFHMLERSLASQMAEVALSNPDLSELEK